GTESANCCKFIGGPFTESRFFGEGVGIAVKRGNDTLRLAFNWALFRLWEKGRFTDLWLRDFPISPFLLTAPPAVSRFRSLLRRIQCRVPRPPSRCASLPRTRTPGRSRRRRRSSRG